MTAKEGAQQKLAPAASVHLDAIRGIAALAVFLGHGRGLFLESGLHAAIGGDSSVSAFSVSPQLGQKSVVPATPLPPVQSRETVGHEAVIVFFVLSGYFVGGSVLRAARKGEFSWNTYLFQRLTRLWIVLLPALLLGWTLDFTGMHSLHSSSNIYAGPSGQLDIEPGLPSRTTFGTFCANLFFLQGIVAPPFGTNTSLWSLSYEFWYYIFFPLMVIVFLSSRRIAQRIAAAAILLALMALCGREISSYFLIWLLGAGVALLPLSLPSGERKMATFASALLLVSALVLVLKFPFSLHLADLILGIVFSFFVWTILHANQVTANPHYHRVAQGLSQMSYTLYLVHLPCFAIISAILMPVWHTWPLSFTTVLMLLGIYAAVFAVSSIMYYCFERNMHYFRTKVARFSWLSQAN